MKRKITYATLAFLLLSFKLALSYVPTSQALFTHMLEKFSFHEALTLEQEVTQDINGEKKFIANAKGYIKYPLNLRVELNTDEKREYIVNNDDIVEIKGGTIISFDRNLTLSFYELFCVKTTDDFFHYLKTIGVDKKHVTLGLHEDRVCYVIGTEKLNENINQLWIDKDTQLPRMLVIHFAGNTYKYEFSDYDKEGQQYFPKLVKYLKNDKLSLEFHTKQISHAELSGDDMFNTKKIRKEHKVDITPGKQPQPSEGTRQE